MLTITNRRTDKETRTINQNKYRQHIYLADDQIWFMNDWGEYRLIEDFKIPQ